ncbi:MAG: His-Xaa-Ser system radical SAM maturase HxsC [Candidatus Azobacteroides pseudotrichonymphae]|jgi:His-Xaa-Ser system radical SAM maturase HxsC|nr:His-Xaa-Ser system radical SAM maturase HxsC [Bacteroidales bacterium OttesenSCG-928-I14]GMO35046.1 MAG: His-Xaa-Ser system radical SAM maturase HxsC [Candidatus Azobacteroides pseudotrichonymphae]
MKYLSGIPENIKTEILGKVTFKRTRFSKKNYIYIALDTSKFPSGYSAILTNVQKQAINQPAIYNIQQLDQLNEGDVICITPDGSVNILYEICSIHNAIIATERCNHRCVMCPQPLILQEKDKTNFNLKLLSMFDKNTKNIGITGGEPTLIGDNLFVLIKNIKRYLPKSSISLLSNGVKFADRKYVQKLALICHPNLQIDVPLFSDIDVEHNRIVGANTFYKTIEGLYNLALFHQKIGLRIVIHKQTFRRLPQLSEFIYRNFPFVYHIAFVQMETTGLASLNIDKIWIDPYEYNTELEEAVLNLALRDMRVSIYNAQLCILPKSIQNYARQSISDWKNIYLPECDECKMKGKCAGFFVSAKKHHSKYIKSMNFSSSSEI